jgi:thiamine-phosphate pyrophosphorylase
LIRGLYAIADSSVIGAAGMIAAVTAASAGGARVVQLRDKGVLGAERLAVACDLARLCRERDVIFLVNDDPGLARASGAHGVHLGRDDSSITAARDLLGADAIIGVSCYNDLDRARGAQAAGADYVAFGSFFPSPTKPGAVRAMPELLRAARAALKLPIVAIGGITPDNGGVLIAAGADALAVIDGVFGQRDIEAAARRYAKLF